MQSFQQAVASHKLPVDLDASSCGGTIGSDVLENHLGHVDETRWALELRALVNNLSPGDLLRFPACDLDPVAADVGVVGVAACGVAVVEARDGDDGLSEVDFLATGAESVTDTLYEKLHVRAVCFG